MENFTTKKPDDFVIATGKNYSVKDLVNLVLKKLNIRYLWKKDRNGFEYAIALNNIGKIKKSQVIIKQEKYILDQMKYII